MMAEKEYLTIYEASQVTGKCQNTIHRYIKKGKLHVKPCQYNGKQVMTVEKAELERVFNITGNTCNDMSRPMASHVNTGNDTSSHVNPPEIKEELKEVIQEFFTTKQAELMRPIEEMALYKLGAVEKENTFLKARLEIILQENQELQDKMKLLPDLQVVTEQKIKDMEELHRQELEKVKNEAEEEKEKTLTVLQAQITDLQKEKEALKIQAEKEKAEAEEREKQMAEAWRKELEEARRPWYRKLFS